MRPHARTLQTEGELVGPDDAESRGTNVLAVVETQLLVVLTQGRNHVHRVHSHSHHSLWGEFPTGFEELPGKMSS